MSSPVICQSMIRVNSDPSSHGPSSVSVCCLGPDLVALLASCTRPVDLLKSIFRISVVSAHLQEGDSLPDVSGRYLLLEDEVQFIPHFPFENGLKYRARFCPRLLGAPHTAESLDLEFLIPSEQKARALTEVTHVFPSCDLLPENLLRFYVCFSNPMQRGRALEEISLLDSDERLVADALYRPPVELWDGTMLHLTVLLDPGRLKRWVGPNVELGPPLKIGQKYTLEIGAGMADLDGRPLREPFRKHFVVGSPVRECISVENWSIRPPETGSRQALMLTFTNPLDWALLLRSLTIESEDGSVIDGRVVVHQGERRWSFTPTSPWIAGVYRIRIASILEDVCGNSITGAFDRPLRRDLNLMKEAKDPSLILLLI
jgi:hypothetical protein